jgi:hypothetical protein
MKALCSMLLVLLGASCERPTSQPPAAQPPTPSELAASHCPGAVDHALVYGPELNSSETTVGTCVAWFGRHASPPPVRGVGVHGQRNER